MCRAIDFDSPFQRECCCGRLAYAAAPASERPFPAPSLAGLVAVGTFAQGGPQVDVAVAGAQAAEVDARNPGAYIARRRTHAFLRWVMRNKLLVRVTIPHQDHPQPRPAQPTPSPRPDPAVAHRGGHPDARRRACSLMGLDRCGVDG